MPANAATAVGVDLAEASDDLGPHLVGSLTQTVGHVAREAADGRLRVEPVALAVVVQVSGALAKDLQRGTEVADDVTGMATPSQTDGRSTPLGALRRVGAPPTKIVRAILRARARCWNNGRLASTATEVEPGPSGAAWSFV